ncbi:MAG: universal stress protein [Saprospirales bacterium]|nr:universal stress protein [Saprospirales bacterium]MBK8489977.1 universal stress protein [Saprospirales bacterium]
MMNRLLLPTDFSDISKNALRYSQLFAQTTAADITVMHACESRLNRFWLPRKKHDALYQQLEDFIRDKDGAIPENVHIMIRRGKLKEVISGACMAGQFRYVVIGKKHAYSTFPKISGTKTSQLFASSHCPVLVVPAGVGFNGINNILVIGGQYRKMDPSVQENILSLSLRFGANLHYLNFTKEPLAWEFNQEILNKQNFLVQKSIPEDIAAEGILDYVQDNDIDLLIMMRNRHKTFETLFSYGFEQQCLSKIDIPLLVFHNNFLQMRLEKEKNKMVGEAVAI